VRFYKMFEAAFHLAFEIEHHAVVGTLEGSARSPAVQGNFAAVDQGTATCGNPGEGETGRFVAAMNCPPIQDDFG
jgi:hypothetical protein